MAAARDGEWVESGTGAAAAGSCQSRQRLARVGRDARTDDRCVLLLTLPDSAMPTTEGVGLTDD
jgi:hypothetical protein